MQLMFAPLLKYATFSGRARRAEFWLFTLFYTAVALIAYVVSLSLGLSAPDSVIASEVWYLAVALPSLAVWVRRLHDTGRSG